MVVSECVVRGNTAAEVGGIEIRTRLGTMTGTTVYANSAEKYGGVLLYGSVNYFVANSIFWGNTDTWFKHDVFDANFSYFASMSLHDSCIEGWNGFPGSENLALDPQFLDPIGPDGVPGTGDDDLRPGQASPCVDAGRNASIQGDPGDLDNDGNTGERTPTDLDHSRRIVDDPAVPDTGPGVGPLVDMGAHERHGP